MTLISEGGDFSYRKGRRGGGKELSLICRGGLQNL